MVLVLSSTLSSVLVSQSSSGKFILGLLVGESDNKRMVCVDILPTPSEKLDASFIQVHANKAKGMITGAAKIMVFIIYI